MFLLLFRFRFSRAQRRHESVSVLLADNMNQGIPQLLGTSLGNHSFRPAIEDYGNTRLKINDQRTAFLIPDILVDSPQNIQPLVLLQRIKGNFRSGAVRRRRILPKSQPDKIACNRLPAPRSITPDRSPDRQSGLPLRQSVTPDMRMFLRIVIPVEAGIHIIIINRTRNDILRGSPGQAQWPVR